MNITKRDLQALRRVIRHVATSDPEIQAEVLRLDAVLDKALQPAKDRPHERKP